MMSYNPDSTFFNYYAEFATQTPEFFIGRETTLYLIVISDRNNFVLISVDEVKVSKGQFQQS